MLNSMIRYGFYTPTRVQTKRKNACTNHDYFENIDSHEKAYYLGLLMSDGYILTTTYNKQMGIALQLKDEYILDRLRECLGKDLKLHRYKNSSKLVVNSDKIYSDLCKLNFLENKSHQDYNIPIISKEFYNSFICGYFDGDGCITIKATGYSVCSIVCNSKIFLEDIQKILLENNIQSTIRNDRKKSETPLYILAINRLKEQKKFGEFIYKNAPIFLTRKHEKFMKIPC